MAGLARVRGGPAEWSQTCATATPAITARPRNQFHSVSTGPARRSRRGRRRGVAGGRSAPGSRLTTPRGVRRLARGACADYQGRLGRRSQLFRLSSQGTAWMDGSAAGRRPATGRALGKKLRLFRSFFPRTGERDGDRVAGARATVRSHPRWRSFGPNDPSLGAVRRDHGRDGTPAQSYNR
jgi:hypothetical protein